MAVMADTTEPLVCLLATSPKKEGKRMATAKEELENMIQVTKDLLAKVESLGPDSDIYKQLFHDLKDLEAQLKYIQDLAS